MPSDRAEWTRGPWIPGWTADPPRAPEDQQQQQERLGSPPQERPDGASYRRVPAGPYWAGNQPPPPQQQQRQGAAQDANTGGRWQQRSTCDPRNWVSNPGHRARAAQEDIPAASHAWWSSYERRERILGPPDGAEAGGQPRAPPQNLCDPHRPAEPPQQSREAPPERCPERCWAGALVGAGIYGFYRIIESITPPGWM